MGESPARKKQQEKVAGAEDATVVDFAEHFFKDILPHIGSKPVRDITAEDVRSVIWRKKEQSFEPPPARCAACSSACSTTCRPAA